MNHQHLAVQLRNRILGMVPIFAFILAYRLSVPKALELEREEQAKEIAAEPEHSTTTSVLASRVREQPEGDPAP